MKKKQTKRGRKQDRSRVAVSQPYEIYNIVQHHCCRGDVPDRGLKKGTTKIIRGIIAQMKGGNPHKIIWRDELMIELEKGGYIWHDPGKGNEPWIERVAKERELPASVVRFALWECGGKYEEAEKYLDENYSFETTDAGEND